MGLFMATTKNHLFFTENMRLAIATGFLGSLTTFSTFSAETATLFSQQQYLMTAAIIGIHTAGSIFATMCGIYTIQFIMP